MTEQVQVRFQDQIAYLQVASEEAPYLEKGFVEALKSAIDHIHNQPDCKVVLVTGGEKNFCLGGSHHALTGDNHLEALPFYVADIPRLLLSINLPTIACMQGHGIGGGLLLGLWCDLVALCESSLYGANFMALGFTPGMGGTVVMEQAFGGFLARRLLFTGKLIKGREIKLSACPISSSIFPKDQVMDNCLNWAEEIKQIPLISLKMLKENQRRERQRLLENGLNQEQTMHRTLFSQEEIKQFIQDHHQQSLDS